MAKQETVTTVDAPKEAKLFTCLTCKQGFDYPDWKCARQPGNHNIPEKTYYHLGGGHIQNVRDRRMFAPRIVLNPGFESLSKTGDNVTVDRLEIEFNAGGIYTTSEPSEQYFLDKKPGIVSGDEGLAAWQKMYLTQEQRNGILKAEAEDLERRVKESNDLLAKAKAQTNG
jgi:hypothetical protein